MAEEKQLRVQQRNYEQLADASQKTESSMMSKSGVASPAEFELRQAQAKLL